MVGDGAAVRERRGVLLTKDFALVCLSTFTMFMSFYLLLPTLPLYVKDIGGQDAEMGLVMAIFTVSAVITRLLVGPALDAYGRKRFFVGGAFAFLVAAALYNSTQSVASILLLRFFHGIGWAIAGTTAGTLVADIAPLERRGEAMGVYGISSNVALALAPGIGLSLIGLSGFDLNGYSLLFAVSAAMAAISLLLTLPVAETRRLHSGRAAAAAHSGGVVPLAEALPPISTQNGPAGFFSLDALPPSMAMFFPCFCYGSIMTFLPLYAARDNAQNVGIYFFVLAGIIFLSRPFTGALSDRLGRRVVIIPAMVFAIAGIAVLSISPGLPVLLAAAVLFGFGFGALQPSLTALTIDAVKPEERGMAVGTFYAAFDSGIALGSVADGIIAQFAGYNAMYLATAAFGALGLFYFVVYARRMGGMGARQLTSPDRFC